MFTLLVPPISVTTSYTQFSTEIDPHFNMNEQFSKAYKSISSRLHLLKQLWQTLTFEAAKSVYQSLVEPIFSFDCIVDLNISRSKIKNLSSIQRRTSLVVNINGDKFKPDHLYDVSHRQACLLVKKCLDGLTCQNLQNYFKFNTHDIRTRNQGKLLILSDVQLETTQSAFFFMGARVLNCLPLEIRRLDEFSAFRQRANSIFLVVSDLIATEASCLYPIFDFIRISRKIRF